MSAEFKLLTSGFNLFKKDMEKRMERYKSPDEVLDDIAERWNKAERDSFNLPNQTLEIKYEQPTLLDQFAMAALSGLLGNSSVDLKTTPIENFASDAYRFAKDMMKERANASS